LGGIFDLGNFVLSFSFYFFNSTFLVLLCLCSYYMWPTTPAFQYSILNYILSFPFLLPFPHLCFPSVYN
jgi:hypothetical protein